MKPRRKLQSWVEQWNRPGMTYVMVFICALYETMLLTRLVLAPHSANHTLRRILDTTKWGMPLFVAIIFVAVVLLIFRRCRPVLTLLVTTFLMFLVAVIYGSAYIFLFLLWILDLYACMVESKKHEVLFVCLIVAGVLGVASAAWATLWHQDGSFTGLLYPTSLCFALCVGIGFVSKTRREQYFSEQELICERAHSLQLAQERDRAVSKSRIAAELHDSVGHDLTAIIALSEGLDQVTGKPEIDNAISMINDLARQGLTDTRTAVKALDATLSGVDQGQTIGKQYHWDDIKPILNHARQTGMAIALTETGRRPKDSEQAHLSFNVTREGITNAIRHGQAVDRVVISWDHNDNGSITISIRDNGGGSKKKAVGGTGLSRLRETVQECGGTFEAGPTVGGWILRVTIPPLRER